MAWQLTINRDRFVWQQNIFKPLESRWSEHVYVSNKVASIAFSRCFSTQYPFLDNSIALLNVNRSECINNLLSLPKTNYKLNTCIKKKAHTTGDWCYRGIYLKKTQRERERQIMNTKRTKKKIIIFLQF